MAAMTDALSISIRRKVFQAVAGCGSHLVLRDVRFSADPGAFVAITGPSGCGKTTLLNIVAGLDRDYEGSVRFADPEPRLAYVFQTPRLLPWRTVRENVALALPPGAPGTVYAGALLERVGLLEAADAYPERLSLGMQRRAALARAFAVEPDVLLMDEPFVSLDGPTAASLRELLSDLWQRRPVTVLFVTHDCTEAVLLGTRIVRLGGCPATVIADVPVELSRAERLNRAALAAEERRIFGAG